jgi:hypothetical protein
MVFAVQNMPGEINQLKFEFQHVFFCNNFKGSGAGMYLKINLKDQNKNTITANLQP